MPLSLLSISVRPAFTAFRMPNGYGPSGRLRSALEAARAFALLAALSLHLANDHQMTPPSHGPLIALRAPEALCFGSAVGHRFAGPPT